MSATLLHHKRYPKFVADYAHDCGKFAVEVCGEEPTWQQFDLYDAVSEAGCRVSVSSGRGVGKTRAMAVIAVWHMLCYYHDKNRGSETVLTAPKADQVWKGVGREIAVVLSQIERNCCSWIRKFVRKDAEKVFIIGFKETWFIHAKTAPKGQSENVSGSHAKWLLILADEASGVQDGVLEAFENTCTEDTNRMCIVSQGSRNSGFFWDTHHRTDIAHGGGWSTLRFDSSQSPLVSPLVIAELEQKYGGTHTDEFRINVRGLFPQESEKYLLGMSALQACWAKSRIIDPAKYSGWVIAFDVGGGGWRDKSAIIIARVCGNAEYGDEARKVEIVRIIANNTIDPVQMTRQVMALSLEYHNATILVDAVGMGLPCAIELAEKLPYVIKVQWGLPCFKRDYRGRFSNQRAQANVFAARAAQEGRLRFLTNEHRDAVQTEGSRIPAYWDEKGRRHIRTKEWMAEEGIKSPDIWDAVCFLFLEGAHYIPSGSTMSAIDEMVQGVADVQRRAKSFFEDIIAA